MQLEDFRRQKAEKKQPKAALPDEISGNADKLSKSTGAPSQPVSSPVKHASEVSEHQSQSRPQPSQDSLLSQPEDRTALRAALGHTDLTKHDKASSAQLPSDESASRRQGNQLLMRLCKLKETPLLRGQEQPETSSALVILLHHRYPCLPTPNSRYCLVLRF